MRLTMAEVKEILESRGLTISSKRPNDKIPAIYWNDEWVGYISQFSVSMHHDLPSLGLTGTNELIPFSDNNADQRLSRMIDILKDSQRRYEERLRQEKVEDIRDYFKYRNIAKQDVREYNKLMKGLMR